MKNCGIVIVNKSGGLSSQAVVNRVKRIFGIDKAGHTGTLDPMATGVLPVLLGRAVKASEYMLTSDKHYRATMKLGITTDTEDTTGQILTRSDAIPSEEEVIRVVRGFVGEIMQVPPMYSALKVGGKKLCDMARRGETIEREARPVTVYSVSAERLSCAEYALDVHCSKGTYIRTLCADIGAALGCGGVMSSLCRTSASGFDLTLAHTLDELEKMSEEERDALVYPVEYVFKKYRKIHLPRFFARLAHSGQEIYLEKISETGRVGETVSLYDEDGFFAVGEIREYEAGIAVKPVRQFVI